MQPSPRLDQPSEQKAHSVEAPTEITIGLMPLDQSDCQALIEAPWSKPSAAKATLPQRIRRFLASPMHAKYISLARRARRIFPSLPIPLRLPFRIWWLAEASALDLELLYYELEKMETKFVKKLLRRDMTVVDVGAHHGLYTLLASKCVSWDGHVVSIEPSPQACVRLEKHLRLNRCSNVELVLCAAGEDPGEADSYVADGCPDGYYMRPATMEPAKTARVQIRRLDDILSELEISKVDFLRLDVRGAELSVLYGAMKLLQRESRPAMLVKVEDARTRQWGYAAREILQFLMRMDYQWFGIAAKGALLPIPSDEENYDANLVALPVERTEEFLELLGQK
jgi:FkbM family methyltransferase